MEHNINTLKEIILDEDRIVSYVSLSRELCLHINDAKSLLNKVIKEIRTKHPKTDLNINYIISGTCDNTSAKTTVCTEPQLETVRNSFTNVWFEHIYSVSKGSPCVDNVALLSLNKYEDLSLCSGLIRSNFCTKRSLDEISTLKSSSQECAVVTVKKTEIVTKTVKKEIKKELPLNSHPEKTPLKIPESKPEVKTEKVSPKEKTVSNTKLTNGNKAQKGIAGFFNKPNNKKAAKENEVPKEVKVEPKIDTIPEQMDVDEKVTEIKKSEKKEDLKPNKKLDQIKKTAKVDKKRKRVLHVSDSESDEEKDIFVDDTPEVAQNHESEDEIPPTPTVETVKITSGIVNPKKKRKIVDKTYTDEDGYIITKKEEVYESCSDQEEVEIKESIKETKVKLEVSPTEIKSVKNQAKSTKKKISPPQKGKQSTLMNFFSKR